MGQKCLSQGETWSMKKLRKSMQIELKEKLSDFYVLSNGPHDLRSLRLPGRALPTSRTTAILYGKPRNRNFTVSQ